MAKDTPRPITLLIAAMGGEGGGVLTSWIVAAARKAGFPVQATSIPGVAQRTGATSYDDHARLWRVTISTDATITVPVPAGGFAIVQR